MKTGDKLYDSNDNEFIIDDIHEETLTGYRNISSSVTSNDGKQTDHFIKKQQISYNLNDIGIHIFYNLGDYKRHAMLKITDDRYNFNKDAVLKFFSDRFQKIKSDIMEEQPFGKIISEDDRTNIILSYYDTQNALKEEQKFFTNPHTQACYARMDLDTHFYRKGCERYLDNHYFDRLYISKGRYHDMGGGIHIVNWRSPIANLYYDFENTSLTLSHYVDTVNPTHHGQTMGNINNVYEYDLMLKRQYTSTHPLQYHNTYIAENDFFSEGTADSFLIEVLKENRSNHKISDIIKSIQSNQNKIIRENHTENLIVQGCAGSGKTMILLHRLSYLKYNSLLPSTKKTKIVSPNENFSVYINDLAVSLELDDIERITMDKYLFTICKKYQHEYSTNIKKNFAGKEINKKEVFVNKEALQYFDNEENIFEGYSYNTSENLQELEATSQRIYISKFNTLLSDLDINVIKDICKKNLIKFPDLTKLSHKDFLDRLVDIIRRDIPYSSKKLEKEKGELDSKILRLNENVTKGSNFENHILKKKKFLKSIIHDLDNNMVLTSLNSFISEFSKIPKTHDKLFDYKFLEKINRIFYELSQVYNDIAHLSKKTEQELFNKSPIVKERINLYLMLFSKLNPVVEEQINSWKSEKKLLLSRNEELTASFLTETEHEVIDHAHEVLNCRGKFVIDIFLSLKEISKQNSDFKKNNFINKKSDLIQITYFYYLHCLQLKEFDKMIFIDEGQDYSLFEYKILKLINGSNCVFNVFGDKNQCIDLDYGITNWDELQAELMAKKYFINENYRNSIEITNFVNDKFKYNFVPIGISTSPVKYVDIYQVEDEIKTRLSKDTDERIAFISKKEEPLKVLKHNCNDHNIFCGTTRDAKGLEFDTVFVFEKDMTSNELYISYTRALTSLFIIK